MRALKTMLLVLLLAALAPFAQGQSFIYGEGVSTEFIFVNPIDAPTLLLVEFFDAAGDPVEVQLEGYGEYSNIWPALEGQEVWSCETVDHAYSKRREPDFVAAGRVKFEPLPVGNLIIIKKKDGMVLSTEVY